MKTWTEISTALRDPFPPEEIEWRLGTVGESSVGRPWAKCLAYLTNRAIQHRLDEVVGCGHWWNEFAAGPQGGTICGISIRAADDDGMFVSTVTKWDGADNTDIESVKGGLSDSMKRAAVQWGMGRYLYQLPEGWAECSAQSKSPGPEWRFQQAKNGKYASFYWRAPELPQWALPTTVKAKKRRTEPELPAAGEDAPEEPTIDGIPADIYAALDQQAVGMNELTRVCREWKPKAIEQGWDHALVAFYRKRGEEIKNFTDGVFGAPK